MEIAGATMFSESKRKYVVFVKDLETNAELGIIKWNDDLRKYNFEEYSNVSITDEMYKRIHKIIKELK